jgi:two-component system phosphate regulon sensor histidine kinase PhoR
MRDLPVPAAAIELLDLLDPPSLLLRDGRIGHANPPAVSLFGAHVQGQDVRLALRHPDVLALITSGRNGSVRVTGLSTSGSIWEVQCNALSDGQQMLMLTDLSVQASVARAHADFVANASHELRTPLAAILGYVETLLDPKAGDDPATRNRFLGIIGKEAQRMQGLVEDLMSLSRIEAVKHQQPTDKVDLVTIARLCVGEVTDQDRVTLSTNVETAPMMGDQGQLAQVLRNLVENAFKYGAADGQIRVSLEQGQTGWINVSVADEGEGIAPEHMPRLTERFYRADAARSRQVGGTGLGLSIVKHIVERHRGRFDIVSQVGHGTTATCIFPPA